MPAFQLKPVDLGPEIISLWQNTKLLAFGAHGCIRTDDRCPDTVVKFAHPTDADRALLQREFGVMRELAESGAVARVDSVPLSDQARIFAFRLEKLQRVELKELKTRLPEVRALVDKIQRCGVCHGDFSPSNIMQNAQGRLLFIDLAFSGPIDAEVPGDFFDGSIDYQRIEEWISYG